MPTSAYLFSLTPFVKPYPKDSAEHSKVWVVEVWGTALQANINKNRKKVGIHQQPLWNARKGRHQAKPNRTSSGLRCWRPGGSACARCCGHIASYGLLAEAEADPTNSPTKTFSSGVPSLFRATCLGFRIKTNYKMKQSY